MNKFLMALAIAAVAAFVTIGQARAGEILQGNTVANGDGSYHVVLYENSNYNFEIVGITANGAAQTPVSPVNQVKITFYNTHVPAGHPAKVVGITGFSGKAGTNAAHNNWGKADPSGGYVVYNGYAGNVISTTAANSFATSPGPTSHTPGQIVLTNGPAVNQVLVALSDGSHGDSYFVYLHVDALPAPEAASVALFLVGLLPLAFVLSRRAGNKVS